MSTVLSKAWPALRRRIDDQNRAYAAIFGSLAVAVHWSTALVEIVAVLLILYFVIIRIADQRRSAFQMSQRARQSLIVWGALACWVIYIVTTLASLLFSGMLFTSHADLVWHPLLFAVAFMAPLEKRGIVRVGTIFVISGLLASAATLIVNWIQGFNPPQYLFTSLTTCADLLGLTVIVALAFTIDSRYAGWNSIVYGVLALFVAGVILWTAECAPLTTVMLAGGVLVASSRRRALLPWGFFPVALLALIPSDFREKVEWILAGKRIDRYVLWNAGIRQLSDVPLLGDGPESFWHVLRPDVWGKFLNKPPASWHNDLLQTWFDSGPIAATALAGLLILAVANTLPLFLRHRGAEPDGVRLAVGLLLFCLTTFSVVGSVVNTAVLGVVFWILMGFTFRLAYLSNGNRYI